ncbi:hypothetical protein Scep_029345 [Stephania cephalantha]|uniref:Aminotransferase-like plant mobile domain-containing protein n=1 Tax=Stephania cephalantha TaxID=152367 RepID=A0AAP0HDG0_9MAGN
MLLEDLDDVGKYAWGAAALAYLYRHLGSATRVHVSQITGYLTLLEGWVYNHFKLGLATPNAKYMDYVQPRVCRWIQKHETVINLDKLRSIRRMLDKLRPSEVSYCVRWSLRGKWQVTSSISCLEGFSILPPPPLPLPPLPPRRRRHHRIDTLAPT